jgi:uncharacterized LabA/DUF88 family protein
MTHSVRVIAFIDGFNFYHAIDEQGAHHLKWVNLNALVGQFAPSPQYDLREVFYFSAYATWRPDAYARHREFVKALRSVGVTPVMGRFKEKFRGCRTCGARWTDHEEKETDVNIGLYLLDAAHRDLYDRALLVTGDSDISPAVRLVRARYPAKQVRILAPPGRGYSMDLVNAAGGMNAASRMKRIHLERSLLPEQVTDAAGLVVATRPPKYAPPF